MIKIELVLEDGKGTLKVDAEYDFLGIKVKGTSESLGEINEVALKVATFIENSLKNDEIAVLNSFSSITGLKKETIEKIEKMLKKLKE